MRSSFLAAFLVVLTLPVSEAAAQRDDQFVWGIGAGATIPSGVAKDNHDLGAHVTAMLGIGAVDSPFGIRFDALYSSLPDADANGLALDQGKATLFTFMPNAVFSLYGSNKRLYAVAGAGGFWYNPDGQGTSAVNDFGVAAGVGMWIPAFNGFVEVKWLNLFNALPDPETGLKGKKPARLFPVTLGIMF